MNLIERAWRRARDWPPTGAAQSALDANRQRGQVAVIVGLMAVVLIGFIALGIEVTAVLVKHQQMQSAADAAAVAGAVAFATSSPQGVAVEAKAVASTDGFTAGVNGVTVTVNNPPLTGPYAGSTYPNAVEVIIVQPQTLVLAGMLYRGAWSVSTRAVAKGGSNASYCALELDASAPIGVDIGNGASVNMNQCGLGANSTSATAVSVYGGATLTASTVSAVGGVQNTWSTINATNGVKTGQPPTADPYANVPVPAAVGCKYNSLVVGWQGAILNPDGVYCGGVNMGNGARVVMNHGVYLMKGGSFSIGGGTTITEEPACVVKSRPAYCGVTIVLTGSGGDYTTVNIAGGANVTLSAPSTGATAGLLFFQDSSDPLSNKDTDIFQGGAQLTFTGALYFPTQQVTFNNGTSTTATCTQLIAWRIVFQGGAAFNSNCANTGVSSIGASQSKLVE